jgi:hypothetical protein
MLNMVEVRTPTGNLLSLPLDDVSDGLILADVDGLDPVDATLVSSSFAGLDGTQYQSARREARNVLLTLELEPDYSIDTVRALRKRLYRFFMPKSVVNLRFIMADGLVVDISGRVEKFGSPLFSKEPKAVISIICNDPDFVDMTPVVLTGSTVSTSTETLVDYVGSIETGIEFVLSVNRPLTEFTIYHRPPDDILRKLDFAASLVAGDVLRISTISGAKGVTLTRSGTESSLLYGRSPQSNWIELLPEDNYIRVYAEGAPIPWQITYNNKYGGL